MLMVSMWHRWNVLEFFRSSEVLIGSSVWTMPDRDREGIPVAKEEH